MRKKLNGQAEQQQPELEQQQPRLTADERYAVSIVSNLFASNLQLLKQLEAPRVAPEILARKDQAIERLTAELGTLREQLRKPPE